MSEDVNRKRKLFFQIRKSARVIVKGHAYIDHPERKFTQIEILNLIRSGRGTINENQARTATPGSVLFKVKDDLDRDCELVVLIEEELKKEDEVSVAHMIIVISAYRRVDEVQDDKS